ncbi:MAG: hypothetical protein JNJ83_17070 [Verrucomicrobiaceae bacterium]|nr:hypothetical protein [Verrucomicrobiaceae bacterium]
MNLLQPQYRVLRRLRAGFSLTEVVVALGLIVATAVPMLGVMSMGFNDASAAVTQRTLETVRTTLRTRLQSPTWPQPQAAAAWQATRFFDAFGKEVPTAKHGSTAIEARMSSAPGIGFQSAALESIKVEFLAVPSGRVLGEAVLQRNL